MQNALNAHKQAEVKHSDVLERAHMRAGRNEAASDYGLAWLLELFSFTDLECLTDSLRDDLECDIDDVADAAGVDTDEVFDLDYGYDEASKALRLLTNDDFDDKAASMSWNDYYALRAQSIDWVQYYDLIATALHKRLAWLDTL